MGIAKVTRNYQVTIPQDVREVQDIKVGDKIIFSIEGPKVEIMKLKKDVIKNAAGLWTSKGSGSSYVKEMRKGWKTREKRLSI